jgi:hypothetical protein
MQDEEMLSDKIMKTLTRWAITFGLVFCVVYITNDESFKSWFRSNTVEISGLNK